MRLWTLHPKYLDTKGLLAVWREALLAQAVLSDRTRGYRNHPQLERFKSSRDPLGAIAYYLRVLLHEADSRRYGFDATKVPGRSYRGRIPVTRGQVALERQHLLRKLVARAPNMASQLQGTAEPAIHPLFRLVEGAVEPWEKAGRTLPVRDTGPGGHADPQASQSARAFLSTNPRMRR